MKEIVDPNYVVDVGYARLPEVVLSHLPDTYEVMVNQSLYVLLLPWLPSTGWPEDLPFDVTDVVTRDDAAWLAAGQSDIAVVPSSEGVERVDLITRKDIDGAVNAIVWMPVDRHERLVRELDARLQQSIDDPVSGPHTRLASLRPGSELGRFLTEVLPQAVASPYKREVLVLQKRG